MSEDYFSFDEYETDENVAQFCEKHQNNDSTEVSGKKPDSSERAIRNSQKYKSGGKINPGQHDMSHMTDAEDTPDSFTQGVRENRDLDATTKLEKESSIE